MPVDIILFFSIVTISPRSYNQITKIMSTIETTQIQYGVMHLRKQDMKEKRNVLNLNWIGQ